MFSYVLAFSKLVVREFKGFKGLWYYKIEECVAKKDKLENWCCAVGATYRKFNVEMIFLSV